MDIDVDPAAVFEHAGIDNMGAADSVFPPALVDMPGDAEIRLVVLNKFPHCPGTYMFAIVEPINPGFTGWHVGDQQKRDTVSGKWSGQGYEFLGLLVPGFQVFRNLLLCVFTGCAERCKVRTAGSHQADPAVQQAGLPMEIHAKLLEILVNIEIVEVAEHCKQVTVVAKQLVQDLFGLLAFAVIGEIAGGDHHVSIAYTGNLPGSTGGHMDVAKSNYSHGGDLVWTEKGKGLQPLDTTHCMLNIFADFQPNCK